MRIAYLGSFLFPDGDAAAARVLGIGKALRDQGHSVVFLGIEKSFRATGDRKVEHDGSVSTFSGFKYRSPAPMRRGSFAKMRRLSSILVGSSIIGRLGAEETDGGRIDAVIAYQPSSILILRLLNWCNERAIPLICDSVEWYDRKHMLGGRFGPLALDSELRMRKTQHLADGVLVVSRYLEDYYSQDGQPTIRVPPLIDISDAVWSKGSNSSPTLGLSLAFVGNAGQKDLLVNAIRGLALLGKDAHECRTIIVGPSQEEVRRNLGRDADLLGDLAGTLHFTGRLPHPEALRHLMQTDYSILLRPNARFAHAGFPTKLVESLAMGVPVICNLTSDIGLYVIDGQEGIIVKDSSPEAFADGMRRVLALSSDNRATMRRFARIRAEQSFDYRIWVDPLRKFLDTVVAKRECRNRR